MTAAPTRAPRRREVEECRALTDELTQKGRKHQKKIGVAVPHARQATDEDNYEAARAYFDRCWDIRRQQSAKDTAKDTPKKAPPAAEKALPRQQRASRDKGTLDQFPLTSAAKGRRAQ
jgi:hypothetical protein